MIRIEYNRNENSTKVSVGDLSPLNHTESLRVSFKNIITGTVHYEAELTSNMWVVWNGAELITDVVISDTEGTTITEWKWEVMRDGDEIEKSLWMYLKKRKEKGVPSNGLVIGSHDGRNGHWIYPVKAGFTSATLIDGGKKQYECLVENYKEIAGLVFMNEIVTPEGGEVTWYEGGEGYTDTVKRDLIQSWLDDSQITSHTSNSISFKELMKNNQYDWLHLDVEGIDGELILSLESFPNIIIYESMNLGDEMNSELASFFRRNGYVLMECSGNTIASKIR
jgi:hypothetical protein